MSFASRLLALLGAAPDRPRPGPALQAQFRLLGALALADGQLTATEEANLKELAGRLLGGGDIDDLIRDARAVPVEELAAELRRSAPLQERQSLMRIAARLAASDGETSEMELANLERFARLLGVEPDGWGVS